MAEAEAYPHHRLYSPMAHRELSVAWIQQALLLGGRHRLDLGHASRSDAPAFHCLEFGCGHGLNLILNAAAHPEGRFYGVDLNPSHVAGATAQAAQLGLGNIAFAVADLRSFAAGRPQRGPGADWPDQVDLVLAHGVAAWVSPEVRQALVAAAAALLRPGGVFLCSYNTYPGWLSQSPLVMLCQELARQAGGTASASLIRATAERVAAILGPADAPLPLGVAYPQLRRILETLPSRPGAYLEGEFVPTHQPQYVAPMHRLCAAHGLTAVGSATLPEQCAAMLDPVRRALIDTEQDPTLREVLFDLVINQSFRRDLFAHGVRPPAPAWRQQALGELTLVRRAGHWPDNGAFATSMGSVEVAPAAYQALRDALAAAPCTLAELVARSGDPLEDTVPLLSVLVHSGLISLGAARGEAEPQTGDQQAAIASFNDRVVQRTTAGEPFGWLVSPLLRQPVAITAVQAFFRDLAGLSMAPEEVAQVVAMGLEMAGASLNDGLDRPLEDPQHVAAHLINAWTSFRRDQQPEWQRLGLLPGAASS